MGAEENGAEVEEEEDVDEEDEEALGEEEEGRAKKTSTKKPKEKRVKKRKTVRARRKRKEMIKNFVNFFVVTQPRHFVLHIPNTPPHHHLCSRNKARRDRLRQFEKNPIQRAKCQTNPYQKRPNIRYKAKKNQSKRWCFLSNNKKKRILFPPLKKEKKKKKKKKKK